MKVVDVVRAYWNEQGARIYDGLLHHVNREKMRNALIGHLDVEKSGVILDVGTGTGFLASLLAESGYKRIIGVDINEHMLRIAKDKLAKHAVRLVQGDALHLPIADNSVDAVVSRWVLWVLPKPEKAIEEMVRVVKPGGAVLAFESDPQKWRNTSLWRKLLKSPLRPLYSSLRRLDKGRGLTTKQFWEKTEGKLPLYSPDKYVQIFREKGLIHVRRTEEDYGTLLSKLLFSDYKFSLIKGIKQGNACEGMFKSQCWEEDDLLKILSCPLCHLSLKLVDKRKLKCEKCGGTYPIVEGIPRLLPPEDLLL